MTETTRRRVRQQDVVVERRQPPWWLPIVAVLIASVGLVLGPCFGAGVAVVGTYVAMQTKSAVTDTKLEIISTDVKQIKETIEKKNGADSEIKVTVSNHDQRLVTVENEVRRLGHVVDTIGGMTAADAGQKAK